MTQSFRARRPPETLRIWLSGLAWCWEEGRGEREDSPIRPRLRLVLALRFEQGKHERVADPVAHDFDSLRFQSLIYIFGQEGGVGMLGLEPVEDVVGFVKSGLAVVEDQDGEFLERVVIGCLGRVIPGDFGLELEGQVLLLQGDADFARVGGGCGGDEGPGHDCGMQAVYFLLE